MRADGNDATPSQAYDDRPAMGAGKYDLDGNPVAAAAAVAAPAPSGKVGRHGMQTVPAAPTAVCATDAA